MTGALEPAVPGALVPARPALRPRCFPGCSRLDGHDGRDAGACMKDGAVLCLPPEGDLAGAIRQALTSFIACELHVHVSVNHWLTQEIDPPAPPGPADFYGTGVVSRLPAIPVIIDGSMPEREWELRLMDGSILWKGRI